jgi:hypothetical protein
MPSKESRHFSKMLVKYQTAWCHSPEVSVVMLWLKARILEQGEVTHWSAPKY